MSRRQKYIPIGNDRTLSKREKIARVKPKKNFKLNNRNAHLKIVRIRPGMTDEQSLLEDRADVILKAEPPKKKTGRPRKEAVAREPSGKIKRPTTSAKVLACNAFCMVWYHGSFGNGSIASKRYPHVAELVAEKNISPEAGILAFNWLALCDRGVRNSAYSLMARASKLTGFLLLDDEGCEAALDYVVGRLGVDACERIHDAIVHGEKLGSNALKDLESQLLAFWATMIEHGKSDNQFKDWDAEGPSWRSMSGYRLKPEHFSPKWEFLDGENHSDWN